MAFKPLTRLALATILLGSSALGAQAGWFNSASKKDAAKDEKPPAAAPGTNLETSIQQAQALRLSGNYAEAIRHLSQLMMVASDDPGVVSEYGKTLAAMGRAQDAVNFLTRAGQLQPTDWTVFSALGVAYDQIGSQKDARGAYEHALTLKPGEPSILSNYALSRMLANDPAMARNLASRAEAANAAAPDAKIAANIALIRSTAPEAPGASTAANMPAPMSSMAPPQAAPRMPVASNSMGAPRPLAAPNNGMIEAVPQMAPQMAQNGGVVMQRVPADPMAGQVFGPAISAAKAPRPLAPKKSVVKAEPKKGEALDTSTARSESPKPAAMPANMTAPGVKSAATQAEDLQARAEALAKHLTNKPAAIAAAKAEANKTSTPHVLPEKTVAAAPVKAAEAKPAVPAAAPHVVPAKTAAAPAPAKTATAPAPKVVPQPVAKTAAAKPKDTVPALRVSSSAY